MASIISTRRVYRGRILDVALEEHAMPDGRQATFEIVRHPGGAAVLPLLPDGQLLLIQQFRPALGSMVYEIPAGRLEPNESAEECAGRELVEEVGYSAGQITPLGGCWSTVGFCDEYIHLFLGRDLVASQQALEPDELIVLCPMSLAEALHKIKNGEILDSKTQLALFQYQLSCMES